MRALIFLELNYQLISLFALLNNCTFDWVVALLLSNRLFVIETVTGKMLRLSDIDKFGSVLIDNRVSPTVKDILAGTILIT